MSPSIDNDNATTLRHRQNLPMTVTLGQYRGRISCGNSSRPFIGSIDEVHIYSTELTSDDIQELIQLAGV